MAKLKVGFARTNINPPLGIDIYGYYVPRFAKGFLDDLEAGAIAIQKDGKMGYSIAKAPDRIAYIRRYKMKDGTTMTCPPINDPNIDHPIGELDQRINVIRFDREGARSLALINYGIHSDTIGGELVSADFEAWIRKTLDKALDIDSVFVCGAQGDVGSTHVYPTESDMNDTEISFDNEMKSPGMARFVGRAIAGAVLQVWDKVLYTKVDKINTIKSSSDCSKYS